MIYVVVVVLEALVAQSRGEQSLAPDLPEPSPLLRQVAKEVVAAEAVLVRLDCASSVFPVSSRRVRLAICISDLIVAADPNRPNRLHSPHCLHRLHRPLLVVCLLVVLLLVVLARSLVVLLLVVLLLVVLLLVVLARSLVVLLLVVLLLVVLALVEEAL